VNQHLILYPVFAQVALTFAIGIWLARLRFAAVNRGDLRPQYFAINRGGEVPEYLAKVNNNYNNLLELPVLFYLASVLLLVMDRVEPGQIILAWVFVASRYAHSYIHTTCNNIRQRMRLFMVGVTALISMWGLFFVRTLLA
jgi:hypothetical protein